MKLHILQGDLSSIKGAEVIVNSANKSLRKGSGVCKAIHERAGVGLEKECILLHPNGIDIGDIVVTDAYDLKAKYVFHVVTPRYDIDETPLVLLRDCYRAVLDKAVEMNVKSIAFPLLGAGIHRFKLDVASKIAVDAVNEYQSIDDIVFVLFDQKRVDIFNSCT